MHILDLVINTFKSRHIFGQHKKHDHINTTSLDFSLFHKNSAIAEKIA